MKINLILLASGNSKRFNGNKLLANINGKPMYKHIVDKVIKVKFNRIILVTQYDEIKSSLSNYDIDVVMNGKSFLGISNTIRIGINHDKKANAYMFMVCDQPFITEKTITDLVNKFINSNKGIACVGYNENTFNPVIFSSKYLPELLSLTGDIGGKKVLKNNLSDLELMQIKEEKEIIDMDTKEDIEKV